MPVSLSAFWKTVLMMTAAFAILRRQVREVGEGAWCLFARFDYGPQLSGS